MPARLTAFAIVLFAAVAVCAPRTQTSASGQIIPLIYTVAPAYESLAWIRGADRFPRGAKLFVFRNGISRPLVAGFAMSADASVSFDATRILFSGKKEAGNHWQVWEVTLRSGTLRQITHCDGDCIRPFYVPDDRLVYAHKIEGRFVLEIAPLASALEKPLQLTHTYGNFVPTDVLHDGRILFEAEQPLGEGDAPELYTVYTDGSGVEAYRCDHGHARYGGKQLASGDLIFAREGRLYRFTSALAHEVEVPSRPGVSPGDIAESPEGVWLASSRVEGQKHFELQRWTPGSKYVRVQIARSEANVVQPVLLAPRPIPNRHPSGLHQWTYANVLCLDAYTSKYKFADGAVASVRLYARDALGETRLLGSSQVERDGSFYLRVPGDQPLKIELLDSSGATLKKEAGWFWLRAGEQRVCVGCHAGPETAPENAVPAVLLRSAVAADLTSANSSTAAGGH